MANLEHLTLLHSNDMHGDFLATEKDEKLMGGISMLSGYVNRVRHEEENVIYAIAGDMFRGSIIDSEFKGASTIELMNMLSPDVATLGNHEVDYGIAHLLFLEKCARFPIINANLYIKMNHVRLFTSHVILEVGGIRVLFIGILTEEVLNQTKKEEIVGTLIDVREAVDEIGIICDAYRSEDVDFTVLLTHIGLDADKRLATMLNPDWGVDLIIGGHSHSYMEKPVVVSGIPIVQTVSGTNQIGRFDIEVNLDENRIESYKWSLIPIDVAHCPRDYSLERVLEEYQSRVDEKYCRFITRFDEEYTHPRRDRETQLGRLFADIVQESTGVDLMLLGSGSLRRHSMGPIVLLKDLTEMIPYDDEVVSMVWTGKQLKKALATIHDPEHFREGVHSEFYQYSSGLSFMVSPMDGIVLELRFHGNEICDEDRLTVAVQMYHFLNMKDFFGISEEEARVNRAPRVIATSTKAVIEEYLIHQELVKAPEDERWITLN